MAAPKHTARSTAVFLLDQVLGHGRLLSELSGHDRVLALPPADRARAQRLALDTLRGMERADRLLQDHLRKNPPLNIRNILRLGTVELCMGGDAHGIVNEAVALASASRKTSHLKGLVNAVLRKIAATGAEKWAALRVPRLPKWLRVPLAQAWGGEAMMAMEAAQFAGAPLDLTVKSDAAGWADRLGGQVLTTGSVRLADAGQVTRLDGFETGDWWVQDAAAALPARILNVQQGEHVLDLCAAPGGKTMQLAATGANVTALDVSAGRIARVQENLKRTSLKAQVITGDALSFDAATYDAILLDAPCSATGTLRRHPDLPYAKDGSEFGALIDMQAAMLDHALTLLNPGGRLMFCTCSLLPDEGEVQIEEALDRHPSLSVDRDALSVAGVDPAWITPEGGLRLRPDFWPDLGGMDGFYMALLRAAP